MKKSFLYILFTFFALFLQGNTAKATSMIPDDFNPGDLVTITGSGFASKTNGNICFNDDLHCLPDSLIKTWTDSKIQFTVPSTYDLSNKGKIIVYAEVEFKNCPKYSYVEEHCYWDSNIMNVAEFNYRFYPYISRINDQEETVDEDSTLIGAKSGDTIIIEGEAFGDSGKVFFVGDSEKKVQWKTWSDTAVTVVVPDLKNCKRIEIESSNGLTHKIDFEIFENFSSDDYSGLQNYLINAKIPEMWENISSNEEIIVAVIDDGVYYNHPDLADKMWKNEEEILGNGLDDDNNGYIDDKYGWNFFDENNIIEVQGSHGTTVAGIIAANRNNEIGIAGIADNVKIMPIIVCDEEACSNQAVVDAIFYAVDNGARVINISLGDNIISNFSEIYNYPVQYAWEHNVILVVSAGNGDLLEQGINTSEYPVSLVCNESTQNMIIGVGASASDNQSRTDWTNYGDCVDIYAQGEGIVSTTVGDFFYDIQDGTSFSAPIVSGVIASVLSAYPKMTNEQIWDYLVNSTDTQILDAEKLLLEIKRSYKALEENTDNNLEDNKTEESEDSELSFSDVHKSHKNQVAIKYMKKQGIINGYSDGIFRPNNFVNRAELLKLIIEAKLNNFNKDEYNEACFSDIEKGDWYTAYVCYAKEKEWVNGYADGTFRPNQTVSKAEAVKIILVAYGFAVSEEASKTSFEDVEINDWYAVYLEKANDYDFLETKTGKYNPNNGMTRANVSQVIYNVLVFME